MPRIILIDGYNKSLFYNVIKLYLKNFKSKFKYTFLDIHEFTQYTRNKSDLSNSFISISKKELIDPSNFTEYIAKLTIENDIVFVVNVSRLEIVDDKDQVLSLLTENFDKKYAYYDTSTKKYKMTSYVIKSMIKNFSKDPINVYYTYLKKENDLFTMNKFLCTTRINDINSFTNTFMPFGGYLIFNYLECLAIDNYYNTYVNYIHNQTSWSSFKDLFKTILDILEVKYYEKQMVSILNSYLTKKQMISIGIILLVIITHIMFYIPYYLSIIRKIKNKKINKLNKIFLIILLLLPITLLIIPSWSIFFIPEIINFIALYKIYHP
jgi:hypothetical protein